MLLLFKINNNIQRRAVKIVLAIKAILKNNFVKRLINNILKAAFNILAS
jgi:hypothetical protein